MSHDQKPREFWIAQGSHADIVCYSEKEAKELEWEKNHIHVIEKSAYDEIERALRIADSEPESRTQEAAHYNWLDDQNQKLRADLDVAQTEIKELKRRLGE